jgi:NADH dehydrogenase
VWESGPVTDPALRGVTVEVGGPENLTLNQLADTFAAVTGCGQGRMRIPRPAMRLMPVLMRPVNPTRARMAHDALVMDTFDFSFDSAPTRRSHPSIPVTSFAEMVRREYVGAAAGAGGDPGPRGGRQPV